MQSILGIFESRAGYLVFIAPDKDFAELRSTYERMLVVCKYNSIKLT
jgi:hypothetical protein